MLSPQMSQVPDQRLHQVQVLAPQMRQALEVLQAPLPELRALIRREAELNPALEEKPEREEPLESESAAGEIAGGDAEEIEFREEYDRLTQLDDDWREYFQQAEAARETPEEAEDRHRRLMDSLTRHERSLQEHLLDQLGFLDLGPEDRALAMTLIGSLNDDGYLNVTLGELAETTGQAAERLERLLKKIQQMDPPGVGARDLRECLGLQLNRAGRGDGLEAAIVRDHLDALAARKFEAIARALNAPLERVIEAAGTIASLEPRPGRGFETEPIGYVVPEIEIVRENDGYVARLKRERLPRIRVNRRYRQMFEDPNTPADTRAYLREKIRAALFLVRSVEQRHQTLLKVAGEIARRQRRFFDEGVSGLEPMTMAEVASVVGLHETTVSRAVNGKYAETPRGTIELRFFFTAGYRTEDGRGVSNEAVKDAVARWIAEEEPSAPLSDQTIANRLAAEGTPVARRTVAKYREELRIPSSHLRRRGEGPIGGIASRRRIG
jgi:RNA polymerase sigma-54 factor